MHKPEIIEAMIEISQMRDFDESWELLKRGAKLLEFRVPYYVSAYINDPTSSFEDIEAGNHVVYKDEYPDVFNDFYNEGQYVNHDPAMAWVKNKNDCATFKEIFQPVIKGELGGKTAELCHAFLDMNSKTGAIISFENKSNFALSAMTVLTDSDLTEEQGDSILAENLQTMRVMANIFHNSRTLFTQAQKYFNLTSQELEILQGICLGQRAKQIAHSQNKFVGVVEKQIANIKRKLVVNTVPQAVAKALHFDLIDF